MNQLKQALKRAGVEAKPPAVPCPYCGGVGHLVTGEAIYPHRPDLFSLNFYQCAPCKAYVGCHKGTAKPLGRLADADLRQAKSQAHLVFDPLWRFGRLRNRTAAYAWLAGHMGMPVERCHIGEFDVVDCERVVHFCRTFRLNNYKE